MNKQVYITDYGFPDLLPEKEVFREAGIDLHALQCKDPGELKSLLKDADALLVQWAPVTDEVIDALDHCKVIVRYGIGVDNVDLQCARRKNIPVCNVPDYCIQEVADHAITLALTAIRQVIETDRNVREGKWSIMLPQPVSGFSKINFCLAGFGRIAREVARRAQALDFPVYAYDPFVDAGIIRQHGVHPVGLEELFDIADVLSLHLPLNENTFHFVDDSRLQAMRSGAIIINTSRGALIDTVALASALKQKKIWKAALDVFETEPLQAEHDLRKAPGVIFSSHVAWYSEQSIPVLQRKAAEEVVRALSGEPLLNRVI